MSRSKTLACCLVWVVLGPCLLSAPATAAELAWGTTVSPAAGTRAELFATTAPASTQVWAVGGYNPGQPPTAVLTHPYAQQWDGNAWTAVEVPRPALYASQSTQLEGVAATTGAGDVWAVGHADDLGSLASRTLAYRLRAGQWIQVATPNPSGARRGNRLFAISASTESGVWAVGETGYPSHSMVLRWNGARWTRFPAPNIGSLVAVTAGAQGVWAASSSQVMQFDGVRWTVLPDPPMPGTDATLALSGIAQGNAELWAVGTRIVPNGFEGYYYFPYAAVWRAAGGWTELVSLPAVSGLTAVVSAGATFWATSESGEVIRLARSGATRDVTPRDGIVRLNAVSATPEGEPWAVGTQFSNGKVSPAVFNAPGIGQGGIRVTTGYSGALVTWIGPSNGSGAADPFGLFSISGLASGSYQIITSASGCAPGVAAAPITEGVVTPVSAQVRC
jgi:hypothetical protein